MDSELVHCTRCGTVYKKGIAADMVRCPVCETSAKNTVAVPKHGRCHKWWDSV